MADTDEASVGSGRGGEARAGRSSNGTSRPCGRSCESLGYREDLQRAGNVHAPLRGIPPAGRRDPAAGRGEHQSQGPAPVLRRRRARPPSRSVRRWTRPFAPVPRRIRPAPGSSAATARIGVLEILALQAPHIAEPRDDAMTRFEEQMKTSAGECPQGAGRAAGIECPRGRGERDGGAGSLHLHQRSDSRAVATEHQRALAGADARQEAYGHRAV